MSMPATLNAVAESAEERFRAIFGAHRTPSIARPEDVRLPGAEDYESCLAIGFTNTSRVLFHLWVENDDEPFLWVGDHVGRAPWHPLYRSSHDLWRADASKQLSLLAQALRAVRAQLPVGGHELELVASSEHNSTHLAFPATAGKYVPAAKYARLALPAGQESYWDVEELGSDPARAWDEITSDLVAEEPVAVRGAGSPIL